MKKKALLLGSLPVLAIASGLFFAGSGDTDGVYRTRTTSNLEQENGTFEAAKEYYRLVMGDYTEEEWERSKALASSIPQDRATFNWIDLGPDNIGGRTRAIVVDRNNINHLYAGSVSGGLFESINRSGTWSKVEEFNQNFAVSSMCQTIDGTFYVATGHSTEGISGGQAGSGARGYGIYKLESDGSFTLLDGTDDYTWVNEIVCDDVNNVVWIACNQGLRKYDAATNTITDVDSGVPSGAVSSLSISKDGNVLVGLGSGLSTIVSNDGGSTFTDVSDDANTPNPIARDGARVEYAISHEKVDGKYRVYASAANSFLRGVWRSADSGINWERIAPAYDGVTPGSFSPFSSGGSGQGGYDNIITVVPGAPDRIILGGIDCYTWNTTGNWEQISQWFLSPTNPNYVHADNHEMVWDSWGRLYIGNDGGVAFSDNAGTETPTFHPANRGYNVTQFYATGFSAHGDVIGGSQDNGTLANWHTGTTWQEHNEVGGGDGFSCHASFINRNIIFSTIYFSALRRSSDRGENSTLFVPNQFTGLGAPCQVGAIDGTGCGQFITNFEMWEHPNDVASLDTLRYIPQEDFSAGDIVQVPSATSQTFIEYTSPIDIVFDDTLNHNPALTIQDTVIVTEEGTDLNLGLLDWEFLFGEYEISEGDSIIISGVEEDDTVVVDDFYETPHYFGTNPDKPGVVIDMGNEEQLFNISFDTLLVVDTKQSWLALDMGGTNGLWMTRNALRFSAPETGWFLAGRNIGSVSSMEFSKDGNYLFIGTWTGNLYRLSGFNSAYSPTEVIEGPTLAGVTYDTLVDYLGTKHVMELTRIGTFGPPVTGIASGAIDDPDHLVVSLGNFGTAANSKVQESTNATGDSPSFSGIGLSPGFGDGASAAGIPCYSVVIDRDDPDVIVVGTEFGIFATEDGGSSWDNVSGGFGNTPVFDMGQNWRTWDEGCKRPGEIYAGTHGRGIWSTDAFLNLPDENDQLDKEKFLPEIKLYPNPVREAGTVEFNLASNEDVTLQIFNLNGQVVRTVNANNLQAGKNQIAFDANELPKGTYILRLSSETMNETTKFIKH